MGNMTQKWVNILIPFTSNYGNKLTGTELAKLSNTPQQTVSRHISKLVKKNMLNYIKQGKNKLFYLDPSNQSTKIILEILEDYKALLFQQKLADISLIINELLKHSESVIVFGSYSSYKFSKSSDLDIAILGKYSKKDIAKIKKKQTIQINEHYISYNEFVKLLKSKNPLALEILKNHTIFGNISKMVDIFLKVIS